MILMVHFTRHGRALPLVAAAATSCNSSTDICQTLGCARIAAIARMWISVGPGMFMFRLLILPASNMHPGLGARNASSVTQAK
jgi:hypothetical protein